MKTVTLSLIALLLFCFKSSISQNVNPTISVNIEKNQKNTPYRILVDESERNLRIKQKFVKDENQKDFFYLELAVKYKGDQKLKNESILALCFFDDDTLFLKPFNQEQRGNEYILKYAISKHQIDYIINSEYDKCVINYDKDAIIGKSDGIMKEAFKQSASAILNYSSATGNNLARIKYKRQDNSTLRAKSISQENLNKYNELTKDNNRVLIVSDRSGMDKHLKRYIGWLGYWKIADDIDDADFIIKIRSNRNFPTRYHARAYFIDPETLEPFYMTKWVNTWASLTWMGKKAASKKLAYKAIRKDRIKLYKD